VHVSEREGSGGAFLRHGALPISNLHTHQVPRPSPRTFTRTHTHVHKHSHPNTPPAPTPPHAFRLGVAAEQVGKTLAHRAPAVPLQDLAEPAQRARRAAGVYACMYTCIWCVCMYVHVYMVCMHVCTSVQGHVSYTYVCLHIYIYTCLHLRSLSTIEKLKCRPVEQM